MFRTFGELLGLIRFSHIVFALPFALSGAALAWSREPFRWVDLLGVLLCMGFARGFAMAFNRIVDRRIDAANPRTAGRHLPSGRLSLGTVVLFAVVCAGLFVGATFLFRLREVPNVWPVILSGPVLLFLAGYSLTKRFTSLAHVWLGASLMMAPIASWIAIVGISGLLSPTLLGLAVLFWVTGFDIIYACQDVDFDRDAKLHSIPARMGVVAALRVALVCHLLMIGVLVAFAAVTPEMGWPFAVGLAVIGVILMSQHRMVRPSDLSRVNAAFFQVNAVVSVGLFVLVVIDLAI